MIWPRCFNPRLDLIEIADNMEDAGMDEKITISDIQDCAESAAALIQLISAVLGAANDKVLYCFRNTDLDNGQYMDFHGSAVQTLLDAAIYLLGLVANRQDAPVSLCCKAQSKES